MPLPSALGVFAAINTRSCFRPLATFLILSVQRFFRTRTASGVLPIRQWRKINKVELIETAVFARRIIALLDDEEYGNFQSRLAADPGVGALIRGDGGIRKIDPAALRLPHERVE